MQLEFHILLRNYDVERLKGRSALIGFDKVPNDLQSPRLAFHCELDEAPNNKLKATDCFIAVRIYPNALPKLFHEDSFKVFLASWAPSRISAFSGGELRVFGRALIAHVIVDGLIVILMPTISTCL
jgi:hypothetical protein